MALDPVISASGVYSITTPSGRVYVGSATCFRRRWAQHRHKLRRGEHTNPILQAAWNKYGDGLEFKVLVICSRTDAVMYEQIAINAMIPEMNVLRVAGSRLGAVVSDESRARMSTSKTGFKHTPETRAAIAEAGTGRTHSDESKALMSAKLRAAWDRRRAAGDTSMSDAARAKIAAARTGKVLTEQAKQKVREARLAYWANRKSNG